MTSRSISRINQDCHSRHAVRSPDAIGGFPGIWCANSRPIGSITEPWPTAGAGSRAAAQPAARAAGRALPANAAIDFIVPQEDLQIVDSLLKQDPLAEFVVLNPVADGRQNGGAWRGTEIWRKGYKWNGLGGRCHHRARRGIRLSDNRRALRQLCSPPFPLSFLQLIPLFKRASLVIGGDTGPFHLACALGTSVVGIFGPTSPQRKWSMGKRGYSRSACAAMQFLPTEEPVRRKTSAWTFRLMMVLDAVVRQLEKK